MTRFDITTCKTILLRYKDILDNSPLDRDLSWMLWGGLVIRFTACFSSRQSRTKLNPGKVFPDKDGIRAMYKVIDDIRDKNIAHDVNWMNSDNAFTQIFSDESFSEVRAILAMSAMRSDIYGIFETLINVSLLYLENEISICKVLVQKYVESMTHLERMALPEWGHKGSMSTSYFKESRKS